MSDLLKQRVQSALCDRHRPHVPGTKVLCQQFVATVSPAWGTLLPAVSEPGAPRPSPPAAASAPIALGVLPALHAPPPAPPRPVIDVSSLSQAERRELLKQLADADAQDGI